MPEYVTNKWLVGILTGLLIAIGGYVFNGLDRTNDVTAAQLHDLERQVTTTSVELATQRARTESQYGEILRRLERIERNQDFHTQPSSRPARPSTGASESP